MLLIIDEMSLVMKAYKNRKLTRIFRAIEE